MVVDIGVLLSPVAVTGSFVVVSVVTRAVALAVAPLVVTVLIVLITGVTVSSVVVCVPLISGCLSVAVETCVFIILCPRVS